MSENRCSLSASMFSCLHSKSALASDFPRPLPTASAHFCMACSAASPACCLAAVSTTTNLAGTVYHITSNHQCKLTIFRAENNTTQCKIIILSGTPIFVAIRGRFARSFGSFRFPEFRTNSRRSSAIERTVGRGFYKLIKCSIVKFSQLHLRFESQPSAPDSQFHCISISRMSATSLSAPSKLFFGCLAFFATV